MLGHRGCRLGVTFPEIYEMQIEAIFEAAYSIRKRRVRVLPEIMIPLVGTVRELNDLKEMTDRIASNMAKKAQDQHQLPRRRHDRDPARRSGG